VDYLDKLLKTLNLEPRFLLGLSIFGYVLLSNPYWIIYNMGLQPLVNEYRAWIAFITLFTTIFFFIQLIPWVKDKITFRQYKKKLLNELKSLSQEEKVLLLYCIEKNQKTISLPISHSVANRLKSKGIVEMDNGSGNATAWAFNINDIIWQKLQKDKSVLNKGLDEEQAKHIATKLFNSFYN